MKRTLTISFLAVLAWSQAYGKHSKTVGNLADRHPNARTGAIALLKKTPGDELHSVTGEGGTCRTSAIWGTLAAWRPSTRSDSSRTSGANLVAPMTGIATPESISIAINGEN